MYIEADTCTHKHAYTSADCHASAHTDPYGTPDIAAHHDATHCETCGLRGIMVCLQRCDVPQDLQHRHVEARGWRGVHVQ